MFKASFFNLQGNLIGSGEFQTQQEAQAWHDSQIGKPRRLPQRDKPVSECSQEELDSAINISAEVLDENSEVVTPAMATLPAQFTSSIVDITAQKAQEAINAENKKFLADTDWKVIRHRDQVELGIATSLTAQEFQDLLSARQAARSAIVE
jgi:hypothetical protein